MGLLTFSSCNANASGLNLKAEAALILPQSGRHTGLHPSGSNLPGGVETPGLLVRGWGHAGLRAHAR